MLHNPHERKQLVNLYSDGTDDLDSDNSDIQRIRKSPRPLTAKHALCGALISIILVISISIIGYFLFADYPGNNTQSNPGTIAYPLFGPFGPYVPKSAKTHSQSNESSTTTTDNGNNFAEPLKVEHSIQIDALEVLQKTVTPKLPGIYHMNKIYNLFVGKPVYELYGIDVIDFTFADDETMINDDSYSVPSEFRSIPNVDPSCDVESEVNSVGYSSASSVLDEQAKSMTGGYEAEYDWTGGIEIDGVSGSVSTSTRNAAMFGHSSASKDGRSKASQQYSWSFSLEASTKLYKAEIDWTLEGEFIWKDSFISSLEEMNNNPNNKTIMSFIHKWGTHVLTKAQTGSYCRETAYVEGTAEQSSVETFRSDVKSESAGYMFWSADRSKSSSQGTSGWTGSEDRYEFGDIYCVGEVQMTSSSCAAQTAEQNNPIITSYEPFGIWEINDIQRILSNETLDNFQYFIFLLLKSLEDCGKELCRDGGSCTLDEEIWTTEFIADWDGVDFYAMWDVIDNEYCFCEEGKNSADCDACLCYGDEDCCCYDGRNETVNNTCAADLLCASNNNNCVAQDIDTAVCGGIGHFISCTSQRGFVSMTCASGKNSDCENTGLCPDGSSTAMRCGYQDLGAWSSTTQWVCGSMDDPKASCVGEASGSEILGGICGSGSEEDCQGQCTGRSAALCVSIEGAEIDSDTCLWIWNASHGVFAECGDGYVATGFCSSGNEQDCKVGDVSYSNGIQCCKLVYS